MTAPVLAGYALAAAAGPGPLEGRSLLDGSRVTVDQLGGGAELQARAAALSEALRRADGRHLVRVRAVVAGPEAVHVVRDHVEGEDLDQVRWAAGGTVDVGLAGRLLEGVIDALADLHEAGLTHGALDAACVRVDASVPLRPTVRVTGWGTAALLGRGGGPADDLQAARRLLLLLVTGSIDGQLPADAERHLRPPVVALLHGEALRPAVPTAAAAPAPPATPPAPARVPTRRRAVRAVPAVVAVLLVAGVVIGGVLLDRAGGPARDGRGAAVPSAPAVSAPYDFTPVARPDGLVVLRSWVLEQDGAVLRGTTVVRNDGEAPTTGAVDEVVPASVADDVDDLAFSPRPAEVLSSDPVVRFDVLGLAPGATTSWQFVVTLPAPVTADALPRLAADAEQARLQRELTPAFTPPPG